MERRKDIANYMDTYRNTKKNNLNKDIYGRKRDKGKAVDIRIKWRS